MDVMELNGFDELSLDEMELADRGSIVAIAAAVAAVGGVLYLGYQCGEAIGKFVYDVV